MQVKKSRSVGLVRRQHITQEPPLAFRESMSSAIFSVVSLNLCFTYLRHFLSTRCANHYDSWPRGKHQSGKTAFQLTGSDGQQVNLQSWETALWPDNSLKWTGHSISASDNAPAEYILKASTSSAVSPGGKLTVKSSGSEILVNTGKITVSFAKKGNTLVRSITTSDGKIVGQNGRLILNSQGPPDDDDDYRRHSSQSYYQFQSKIEEVTVDTKSTVRALVTVRGKHETTGTGKHADWLPFVVRFYLYEDSEAIKIVHTIVFDGKAEEDFITGLGITFDVPLKGEELYNRRKSLIPYSMLQSKLCRRVSMPHK